LEGGLARGYRCAAGEGHTPSQHQQLLDLHPRVPQLALRGGPPSREASCAVALSMRGRCSRRRSPLSTCSACSHSARRAPTKLAFIPIFGMVRTINLTLDFGFIPQQYCKATIRAAYLAVFCVQGMSTYSAKGPDKFAAVIDGTTPVNLKGHHGSISTCRAS